MIQTLTQNVLYRGSDTLPSEQTELHAGPVMMVCEHGSLRDIRLGNTTILQSIYSAVRDENWGTVPGQLTVKRFDIGPDSFWLEYTSEHRQNEIDFVWRGTITGESDGTVVFEMEGEARSTFRRNRIGFCVLHPMTVAGQSCTIIHVDGSETKGEFPRYISPHQPFKNIRAVRHEVTAGVVAEVLMEGDTFEMEDQRNWTDASYKTYCTPLEFPFPVTVNERDRVVQRITLRLNGNLGAVSAASNDLTVHIGQEALPLPSVGLQVASHGHPLSERELSRLAALNLVHLRLDLHLARDNARQTLERAVAEARELDVQLEIALHLSGDSEPLLQQFTHWLQEIQPLVARWIVFHDDEISTRAPTVELARRYLGGYDTRAPIGAGTDAFFTELNRNRPPLNVVDFVAFSLNPQVHAFDNQSLVETLAVQGANVETARHFSEDAPVIVSPVTLKMRWNPNATSAPKPAPPGDPPPQVDPRQMSLLVAGWTLGSIKYLAEAGAASLTYFETTGWLGVMETEQGSPLPEKFPSIAGAVFPVFHVLGDIGEGRDWKVVPAVSSDRMRVDALVLRNPQGLTRILLANHTPHEQSVRIPHLAGRFSGRFLDASNAETAMRDPESFRASPGIALTAETQGLQITLRPFAVVTLDSIET